MVYTYHAMKILYNWKEEKRIEEKMELFPTQRKAKTVLSLQVVIWLFISPTINYGDMSKKVRPFIKWKLYFRHSETV